ncbi:MAG: hypothetical protein OEM97_07930, partial [Acidimicrobiia bacterium]|nr:hypothetical protein [Acidimicrobiia bacterium]
DDNNHDRAGIDHFDNDTARRGARAGAGADNHNAADDRPAGRDHYDAGEHNTGRTADDGPRPGRYDNASRAASELDNSATDHNDFGSGFGSRDRSDRNDAEGGDGCGRN